MPSQPRTLSADGALLTGLLTGSPCPLSRPQRPGQRFPGWCLCQEHMTLFAEWQFACLFFRTLGHTV